MFAIFANGAVANISIVSIYVHNNRHAIIIMYTMTSQEDGGLMNVNGSTCLLDFRSYRSQYWSLKLLFVNCEIYSQ